MTILPALRSESVGADTYNYILIFEQVKLLSFYELFDSNLDKGYLLFNYIVSIFFDNYINLFFIFYFMIFFNYLKVFNDNSKYVFLSILVFLCMGSYFATLNIMRQMLAISICLLSIKNIFEENFLKFLCLVLFAALFHVTAFIFIFIYFIYKYKKYINYILFSMFIFIYFIFKYYISEILFYFNMSESYAESSGEGGGLVTLLLYSIIFIYFSFVGRKIKSESFEFYLNVFKFCLLLIFVFMLLRVELAGPMRLTLYYSWPLYFLFPGSLDAYKDKFQKIIIYFLYVLILLVYLYVLISFEMIPVYEFGRGL